MDNIKVTEEERHIIEQELRRGTSKSRIVNLLEVDNSQGFAMIERVKQDIRPEVGSHIRFSFRDSEMTGVIIKLLSNSAVVEIYWDQSDIMMKDICEDRTIVNFKDIQSFINLPPESINHD